MSERDESMILPGEVDIHSPHLREDSKEKDFIVDYDHLFVHQYDPLKDTIRYLMGRLSKQDALIAGLQGAGDKYGKQAGDQISNLEKEIRDLMKDFRNRIEKCKSSNFKWSEVMMIMRPE